MDIHEMKSTSPGSVGGRWLWMQGLAVDTLIFSKIRDYLI